MRVAVGTVNGLYLPEGLAHRGHSITAFASGHLLLDGTEVDGTPLPTDAQGTCLVGFDGGALVGLTGAHLWHSTRGSITSFDEAEGRQKWYTPWGGPPDVRSLAVTHDGALLVNVHVGGISRSTDGGETWSPTIDIDHDVHQVLAPDDRPHLVLAACAHGLARSDDGGVTWSVDDDGLEVCYSRSVALAGDTVLVSASAGPGGARSAVYRRPLDGDRFERCQGGLPEHMPGNIDTHCLVASGELVAVGTHDGRVFASEDAGVTWDLLMSGLPPVTCMAAVP